jgi:hypothetical protein
VKDDIMQSRGRKKERTEGFLMLSSEITKAFSMGMHF